MKKLIIVVSAILMTSCAMQPYTRMYLTDYTCYASEGMFVSPFSDFNGVAYTPLGDVMVEYFEGRSQSGTPISPVSLQQMLDKLVGSARAINANGLLNVKISFESWDEKDPYSTPLWYASGTAVKFEGEIPQVDKLFEENNVPQINNKGFYGQDLVERTLEYCHKNNIPLKKEENKEEYIYDINTHSYIKHYLYWQKYGMPTYDLLMKQYKKNKK